ncbi:unnamed protein product [Durusdinium trenchii]|uniref:Uncharacterized protein n=1 Tax=Durusdinium trenchii TaxID=1381693 RepID=A0ABP0RVS2_9DINO
MSWPALERRRPRPYRAPHLPAVASLPVLPAPTVHLYEHIHEHHHYFYRPEQGQVKETPITEEVRPEEGPVTEQMVTVETRLERRRSTVERSNAPKRRASKAEEAEPMTIPRIVVEQVDGPPSSSQSQTDLEEPPAPNEAEAEDPFPRWKKTSRPKPKPIPKPAMDFLKEPKRLDPREEGDMSRSSSRSSVRSINSQQSHRASVRRKAKAPTAPVNAEDEDSVDPLSLRLKLIQDEQKWSDFRRYLKRHLRELPDSSKSEAKQKLMGRRVTGTSKDRSRLEHQKAKESQQSQDLVRHVEEELRACTRSRDLEDRPTGARNDT